MQLECLVKKNGVNGKDMNRWFISMVSDGNYLYWVTELRGHILKMKIEDLMVEYITPLGDCNDYNRAAILCINDNKIYYVVEGGEQLIIYDMINNTTKKFDIKCGDMYLNMFSYANIINNILVIIPMYAPSVVNINIKNGVVDRKLFENYKSEDMNHYYTNCIVNKDESIIDIVNIRNHEYLTYSVSDEELRGDFKISLDVKDIVSIEKDTEKIYILDNQNNVYQYNKNTCQRIFRIDDSKDGYFVLHRANDFLWIMPLYGNDIYKYDIKTEQIVKFDRYPSDYIYNAPKTMGKFSSKCSVKGKTYFTMHAGTYIFCVNDLTGEGEFLDVKWPGWKEEAEEVIYKKMKMIYEMDLSFESFLKYGIRYGFETFLK